MNVLSKVAKGPKKKSMSVSESRFSLKGFFFREKWKFIFTPFVHRKYFWVVQKREEII